MIPLIAIKAFFSSAKGWAAIIVVVAILGFIGYQKAMISHLNSVVGKRDTRITELSASLESVRSANITNQETIGKLKKANDEISKLRIADAERIAKLGAERDAAKLAAAKSRAAVDAAINAGSDSKECKAYLDVVVVGMCPAIAAGMQERSRAISKNRNR